MIFDRGTMIENKLLSNKPTAASKANVSSRPLSIDYSKTIAPSLSKGQNNTTNKLLTSLCSTVSRCSLRIDPNRLISTKVVKLVTNNKGEGQKQIQPSVLKKNKQHISLSVSTQKNEANLTSSKQEHPQGLSSHGLPSTHLSLKSNLQLTTKGSCIGGHLRALPSSVLGLASLDNKQVSTQSTPRDGLRLSGSGVLTATTTSQTWGVSSVLDTTKYDTSKKGKKAGKQESKAESHRDNKPVYDLKEIIQRKLGDIVFEDVPVFVPPGDVSIIDTQLTSSSLTKQTFVNAVCGSLIRAPNFKERKDAARIDMVIVADEVCRLDPEFILKVALYARCELNIRTTSNFLLAYSANQMSCRPFLKKYFNQAIRLPSDWIDVAELYQAFYDKRLSYGSLPSALRRVMMMKFAEFDQYQLAKYNKEKSRKKKQKTAKSSSKKDDKIDESETHQKKKEEDTDDDDEDSDNDDLMRQVSMVTDDGETEEELEKKTFTLKQLIRQLHITEPVNNVMCLIGKKYPETPEEFYRCRLPGIWNEEMAGKRMKLPTPHTWETVLSAKGNKASSWQELIDSKKLPFMAMLRNIRNMIKAGISTKHHNWVIKKLTDERAVAGSRQFPFRFFSAYEILDELEKAIEAGGHFKSVWKTVWDKSAKKTKLSKQVKKVGEIVYDAALLTRYRKALDTSVKIATVHNVQPIKGSTIIFCSLASTANCTAAKGLGKPRTVTEVAVLLSLMCKYSCENCKMVVYGNKGHQVVELEKGSILDNMSSVLQLTTFLQSDIDGEARLPESVFEELLIKRTQVDNMIIMSDNLSQSTDLALVNGFLPKYRCFTNENLLFVSVDLSGRGCGFSAGSTTHPNDICIAGYSDAILRFVAERGGGGQLIHIGAIDKKYNLQLNTRQGLTVKEPTIPRPLPVVNVAPRWKTVRVFISSTFRDMHGERDLLTRFVFPEIRAHAKKKFINVHEVDLRWGVTEEETRSNKTIELCLSEVKNCQLFIGLLGDRYGWVPDRRAIPDDPEYDWIKDYPEASITELEMLLAMQADGAREQVFFYIRDNTFMVDVSKKWRADFESETKHAARSMAALKERLCQSGMEVYNEYFCYFAGVVDQKPMVGGLEDFGYRVFNNIWNAIQKKFSQDDLIVDEESHVTNIHEAHMHSLTQDFIGRKNVLKQCMNYVKSGKHSVVVLSGKAGSGKSAVMAKFIEEYQESSSCSVEVFSHFVGSVPGSTNIIALLRRLIQHLSHYIDIAVEFPQDFKNLVQKFHDLLKEAGECQRTVVLCLDDIDLIENTHQGAHLTWLPDIIPENVIFVLSMCENSLSEKLLRHRQHCAHVIVDSLDIWEKADLVRQQLAQYRKKLDESPFNNQLKLLLSKRQANNPLFLRMACDELRVFGLFEQVTMRLKTLAHTIPGLLQEVLTRVEEEHGAGLVTTALSLLALAREGLNEDELHELLSYSRKLDNKKFTERDITVSVRLAPDELLPQNTFMMLLRSLHVFLRPPPEHNSTSLLLSHAEIKLAIRQRYMKTTGYDQQIHTLLSAFYYSKMQNSQESKAYSELPYHLACCGAFSTLERILCNLTFLEVKCKHRLCHQLLEDFQAKGNGKLSLERARVKFLMSSKLQEYRDFIARNQHILEKYPNLALQQALNEPSDSIICKDLHDMINQGIVAMDTPMIEWCNRPNTKDPCHMTLSGFKEAALCVAISGDERHLACGLADCTVKVFDISSGQEVQCFMAHSGSITGLCFVGKDKLCSSSDDSSLSLWNFTAGHRIAVLKNHTRKVSSVTSDSVGDTIVSVGWDCATNVWSGKDGQHRFNIKDRRPINCVCFHPEGNLFVTGSWDATLKIWDLYKNRKAILRGHQSAIRDVAYSPSGRHIASASMCGEVKIWSADHGTQVGQMKGHSMPVNKLSFTTSGKELVTASDDRKIKVWSGSLGNMIGSLKSSYNCAATSITLSPDAEKVAVGYHDGQLNIYTMSGMFIYAKHLSSKRIGAVQFSPDGCLLFVGSDSGQVFVISVSCTNMNHVELSPDAQGGILSIACQPMPTAANTLCIAVTSDDCNVYLYQALAFSSYSRENRLENDRQKSKDGVTIFFTIKAPLSNFYPCVILLDGEKYSSTEQYYQYQKALTCGDQSMASQMMKTSSPSYIKRLSRKLKTPDKWKEIKIDVMYTCVRAKFEQNETLQQELLCTHEKIGEASEDDLFWGIGLGVKNPAALDPTNWKGLNMLGKVLTDIREELRFKDRMSSTTPVATLNRHEGPVTGCDFSNDGTQLVTCSRDRSLMFWGMSSIAEPVLLNVIHEAHINWINCVSWSDLGNYVVTGSNDFTLKLWDINKLYIKEKRIMTGHTAAVTTVSYKHGCIMSTDFSGKVVLWSQKGVEITTLQGTSGTVHAAALNVKLQENFTSNSNEGDKDEINDWSEEVEKDEWKDKHEVTKLDKQKMKDVDVLVVTASENGTADIWRPLEANELATFIGHSDRIIGVDATNVKSICSSSLDKTVKIWSADVGSSSTIGQGQHEVTNVNISPDGRHGIAAYRDGKVSVWDAGTGTLKYSKMHKIHDFPINGICFVDNTKFCIVGDDCRAQLYVIDQQFDSLIPGNSQNLSSPITCVSCPPEEDYIVAMGTWDGKISIWNHTANYLTAYSGHADWVLKVGFISKDKLVSFGGDSEIIEWQVQVVNNKVGLHKHRNINIAERLCSKPLEVSVYFTLREDILIGTSDGCLQMTKMKSHSVDSKNKLMVHHKAVTSLLCIENLIVSASNDSTLKVWKENDSGRIKQVGHFTCKAPVVSMAAGKDDDGQLYVMCGDTLGLVMVLSLARVTP